jgi:GNAT superfamily N-acetyltransferase
MIKIREADEADNDALLGLQKKSPMGVSLILAVDSSPDYFARSRPYDNWKVFVATENQRIVGSAACAIKELLVQGKPVKTAFEYGFMIDPQERRKGIATQLQKHIENFAHHQDAELLHLFILKENLPSMKLFQKMGFECVKDCLTLSTMVYKEENVQNETNIKNVGSVNIEDVVSMINEAYYDYEFYSPFDKASFQQYTERLPHYKQEDILVFQRRKDVIACLGFWNHSKITRISPEKAPSRLKALSYMTKLLSLFAKVPKIPEIGKTIKQWYLFPVAYRDANALTELIKQVNNMALRNDVGMLTMTLDCDSPIISVLSRFRNIKVKTHYFLKSLGQIDLSTLKEKEFYIDVVDI